jgi:hypothetical protein
MNPCPKIQKHKWAIMILDKKVLESKLEYYGTSRKFRIYKKIPN